MGYWYFYFLASIQRIKTTFWESNWKLFNKNLNFSKCTFEILIGTISWGLDHAGLNVQYFELLCNQFEPALVVQDCVSVFKVIFGCIMRVADPENDYLHLDHYVRYADVIILPDFVNRIEFQSFWTHSSATKSNWKPSSSITYIFSCFSIK